MVLRRTEKLPSLDFLELWNYFDIKLTPWTFNKLSKLFVIKLVVQIYDKMSSSPSGFNKKLCYPGGEIDRLLEYPKTCQNGKLFMKTIEHLGKGILMKVIIEYLKIQSGDKKRPAMLASKDKLKLKKNTTLRHETKRRRLDDQ